MLDLDGKCRNWNLSRRQLNSSALHICSAFYDTYKYLYFICKDIALLFKKVLKLQYASVWPTQCVQVLLGLCSLKIQDMNYFQNITLFIQNSLLLNRLKSFRKQSQYSFCGITFKTAVHSLWMSWMVSWWSPFIAN
jgi:hypothetical protein